MIAKTLSASGGVDPSNPLNRGSALDPAGASAPVPPL